jgi:hypothetical protein
LPKAALKQARTKAQSEWESRPISRGSGCNNDKELWIAELAEHSFRRPFQLQGKSQRVLELLHDRCGEPANSAFETHYGQLGH